MKVENKKEFEKQYKENIYNSGKYIECTVLVGSGEEVPVAHIEGGNITTEDLARLIISMKLQIKELTDRFPEVKDVMKNMQVIDFKDVYNKMFEEGE